MISLQQAWQQALAVWDASVALSPPRPWHGEPSAGDGSLACLDLETRQIMVNLDLLQALGAENSLVAVLAHEVGHHVRFPHTVGLVASLRALETRLLPPGTASLVNLFFDLLVNEVVGRTRAAELAAVYRGYVEQRQTELGPTALFCLSVYQAMWPGIPVLPPTAVARMDRYEGWQGEARMFAQTFFALSDPYLQFVYFCSVLLRYIPQDGGRGACGPLGGDLPQPAAEDLAAAALGNPQADRALQEAETRGWLEGKVAPTPPLAVLQRLAGPDDSLHHRMVAAHYHRLCETYLFAVEVRRPAPEQGEVAAATLPWEFGDDPHLIDWTTSLLAHGALAPVQPLQRRQEPDSPASDSPQVPELELYLDTSGSMPSPYERLNSLTLAAQILATAVIRGGGRVRAVLYSQGRPQVSDWLYDEDVARTFLLQYAGGGTEFPFATLAENCRSQREAVTRVVVSDDGFVWDVARPDAASVMAAALDASAQFLALLVVYAETSARRGLRPLLAHPAFRPVLVLEPDDLAGAAAATARALLDR